MTEKCQCPPEAGAGTCELAAAASTVSCPDCLRTGKPVNALTLKALLAVPLTEVREVDYGFCRTQDCPVVYYSADGQQRFWNAIFANASPRNTLQTKMSSCATAFGTPFKVSGARRPPLERAQS